MERALKTIFHLKDICGNKMIALSIMHMSDPWDSGRALD
jgi:hypothetical protein